MNNPFTPDKFAELNRAAKKYYSETNLFGAALIALSLPYAESVYKREFSIFALISLLISVYLGIVGYINVFPEIVFEVNRTGTEEQKKYMKKLIFKGFGPFIRCWMYWLGWIFIGACMLGTVWILDKNTK